MNSALKVLPRLATKSGQSTLFEAVTPHWEIPVSILVLLTGLPVSPTAPDHGVTYASASTVGSASAVHANALDWDRALDGELSRVARLLLNEARDLPSDAKSAIFENLWELYD